MPRMLQHRHAVGRRQSQLHGVWQPKPGAESQSFGTFIVGIVAAFGEVSHVRRPLSNLGSACDTDLMCSYLVCTGVFDWLD